MRRENAVYMYVVWRQLLQTKLFGHFSRNHTFNVYSQLHRTYRSGYLPIKKQQWEIKRGHSKFDTILSGKCIVHAVYVRTVTSTVKTKLFGHFNRNDTFNDYSQLHPTYRSGYLPIKKQQWEIKRGHSKFDTILSGKCIEYMQLQYVLWRQLLQTKLFGQLNHDDTFNDHSQLHRTYRSGFFPIKKQRWEFKGGHSKLSHTKCTVNKCWN